MNILKRYLGTNNGVDASYQIEHHYYVVYYARLRTCTRWHYPLRNPLYRGDLNDRRKLVVVEFRVCFEEAGAPDVVFDLSTEHGLNHLKVCISDGYIPGRSATVLLRNYLLFFVLFLAKYQHDTMRAVTLSLL